MSPRGGVGRCGLDTQALSRRGALKRGGGEPAGSRARWAAGQSGAHRAGPQHFARRVTAFAPSHPPPLRAGLREAGRLWICQGSGGPGAHLYFLRHTRVRAGSGGHGPGAGGRLRPRPRRRFAGPARKECLIARARAPAAGPAEPGALPRPPNHRPPTLPPPPPSPGTSPQRTCSRTATTPLSTGGASACCCTSCSPAGSPSAAPRRRTPWWSCAASWMRTGRSSTRPTSRPRPRWGRRAGARLGFSLPRAPRGAAAPGYRATPHLDRRRAAGPPVAWRRLL
jgi:hypothetical protein